MPNEKSDPSEDDVLSRLPGTPPTPRDAKRPADTPGAKPGKPKGKGKVNPRERKRETYLTFDMGTAVDVDGFRISEGRVTLVDKKGNGFNPVSQVLEHFRERENRIKGPKPLSRIPLGPAKGGHIDPNAAIFEFERIAAFDTNTIDINGEKISVAVLVDCEAKPNGRCKVHYMEFANADCPPDLFTLSVLLDQMERWPVHPRVAFVTDWGVANHAAIQSRELPVLDDIFLPEWATLLFASSDARDHLVNQLLREADRLATLVLDVVKRGEDRGP